MVNSFARPTARPTISNRLIVLGMLVAAMLPLAHPAAPSAINQSDRAMAETMPGAAPPVAAPSDLAASGPAPITAQPVALPTTMATPAEADDALQAFVQDATHGDGEHTMTISAQAQNYQADDGSWQPIEARFSRDATGFSSLHNLLQVRAEQNRAGLQLAHNAATVA